ncbi:MAG: GntR family transcriptional regulator [Selenomonadaceae bacterium]|nr:GntR family transcriptional regulator [Selenomonadaceae bacterium]MDY2686355.1 GntR family transcriptional regulator [Selenomonadaceae bacterium]
MLKYEAIAQELREKIHHGEYRSGEQLPLEKEMCDFYGVSRITIRRAVDELVKNGLVIKRRGAGTFVKSLKRSDVKELSEPGQFLGFAATYADKKVTTKVLRFAIVHPDKMTAGKLRLSEEDFVYDIVRVRSVDGEPIVVEYTKMPIERIPRVKHSVLEHSIYRYIEEDLGLKIQSAHRIVRAVMPTELEKEELHIEGVLPLLEVTQTAFLDDGRPFEYSISRHRGDKSDFRTISVR